MSVLGSIRDTYDLVIVGAGPAGMAAATLAARAGIGTLLVDEQPGPGGQIYRAVTETPLTDRRKLGDDYWAGEALARAFAASGATYLSDTTVWSIARDREIGLSSSGAARLIRARRIILATGAQERPFPIPGWTLPGVMTAGAAQILLKTTGMVPRGRLVLAGTGPLLWLLAWQYLNVGAEIGAILDTTPSGNLSRALPDLPGFLASPYLRKGLKLLWSTRRRVNVVPGVTEIAVEGTDKAEAILYRAKGVVERIALDTLLLHQGVVPNVNLAMSIGIEHHWDEDQLAFLPELGPSGETNVEGIAIAGDGAGIAGAEAAAVRGRLAALAAVRELKPDAEDLPDEAALRRQLARWGRGRRFLDRLYRPAEQFRRPEGDTVVCRCEEVTARQVTETVALGCTGPNQMKSFLRSGMGPCQGRLCGLTVTELIAGARGATPEEVGYYRLRPPVKPITLAELAALPKTAAGLKAVLRN
jgi:thioredoxin reductase/bacterioferritin-associated ferredoxin